MKAAIAFAVSQAIDIARRRGARLLALTIRGDAEASDAKSLAVHELERLGHSDAEVHVVSGGGTLRLHSVEVDPGTSRR